MEQLAERQTIIAPRSTADIPPYAFYTTMYGNNNIKISNSNPAACTSSTTMNCIYDICAADRKCTNQDSTECKICRIAEQIWGNCEADPTTNLNESTSHNKIIIPKDDKTSTLLSWFALNTGTDKMIDSCRDTSCGPGYSLLEKDNSNRDTQHLVGTCVSHDAFLDDNNYCPDPDKQFTTPDGVKNCCNSAKDDFGNCCGNGGSAIQIDNFPASTSITPTYYIAQNDDTNPGGLTPKTICTPSGKKGTVVAAFTYGNGNDDPYYHRSNVLICMGNVSYADPTEQYPSGQTVKCDGKYIMLDIENGIYYSPYAPEQTIYPIQTYKRNNGKTTCTLEFIINANTGKWQWSSNNEPEQCSATLGGDHMVSYE